MNKLINDFNRGFSLKNNDFRFIDESVRLALSDLCMGMSGEKTSFIIWGAVMSVSGTTATVTEGSIFHQGEIWHVPAHTFAVADPMTEEPYWQFVTALDAAGAKLDKDLVSHNTYELRTCRGSADETGADVLFSTAFSTVDRLVDILFGRVLASGALNSGVTGSVNLIKVNGIVNIDGSATETIISGDATLLFTLPSGFRPRVKIYGECLAYTSSGGNLFKVVYELTTSGQYSVRLSDGQGTASENLTVPIPFQSFIVS